MIDISPELKEAFKNNQREIYADVVLNFSDISLDANATVTSAEDNQPNFNYQLINGNTVTDCKWLAMDGLGDMSGDWCMMPADTTQNVYQVGLWSTDNTAIDSTCNVTYNILQDAKDVTGIQIYGDNRREEYPVDFTVKFFDSVGLVYTDTVVGNTLIAYSFTSPTVLENIINIEVNITKYSTAETPVKVLATLTSLTKTFSGSDIINFNIQDESEIVGTSTVPTGNISYARSSFTLLNRDRIFDVNNISSPLYQQIKQNSKVDVYVGAKTVNGVEKFKVFSGWTEGFNAPENSQEVTTEAFDRLKRLSLTFMSPTAIQENQTVGDIFTLILADADISSEFINIESRLFESQYNLPVYFIAGEDHLSELRRLSEAVSTSVYVKNDVIYVESIEAISFKYETRETYTISDYADKTNKPLYEGVYNTVRVPYKVYQKSVLQEVYATPPEELDTIFNGTQEYTFTFTENRCIDHVLNFTPPPGITVTGSNYYSDRAVLEITNTGITQTVSLSIDAKIFNAVATKSVELTDVDSVADYGKNDFNFEENDIIQTSGLASTIVNNLLGTYKDPFRDATIQLSYAGLPALELTDKITIVDRYLSQGYNIVSKRLNYDGGLSLVLKARKAALKDSFLIDNNENQFIDDLGNNIITLTSDIVTTSDLTDNLNNQFVTDLGFNIIVGG